MSSVAILHPGEMGTAVGRALLAAGHHVSWLPAGRGAATRRRAEEAGFAALDSLTGVDVAISLCPPDAALDVARSVRGFTGRYVDANAVSPATAKSVAALVGGYLDGSVIGPPPSAAGTTRIYLSGAAAGDVAALFDGTVLEARVVDGQFAASALKMAYAAWTKIGAALLISAHELAEKLGVGDELAREWDESQPGLAERLGAAQGSAAAKGWRWTGEMREIAESFAAAGLPPGFAESAAATYAAHPRPAS